MISKDFRHIGDAIDCIEADLFGEGFDIIPFADESETNAEIMAVESVDLINDEYDLKTAYIGNNEIYLLFMSADDLDCGKYYRFVVCSVSIVEILERLVK